MNYNEFEKNSLGRFGQKIYFLLVENSYPTFFVGGVVRDLLLGRPITDIDIATSATPAQVSKLLTNYGIKYAKLGAKFGVITAQEGSLSVEIATFRQDLYGTSRYPVIKLVKSPGADSKRRDFTINSLYLSLNSKEIKDFHHGLRDLALKEISFIGQPSKRIKEDPLRIVRALRFAIILDFKLNSKTKKVIENNFNLIKKISKSRLKKELEKVKNKKQQQLLIKILDDKKYLTFM